MSRYRILHLITRLELGGAQQNTLFCTRHHPREVFDVHLVAGRGGMLDAEARGIPDATVQLVPYLDHEVSPVRDLLAVLRLRAYFRAQRIDLVHTHSSKAGIVGRIAALLAGVPVVVHTVHGWSFNPTQAPWRRRLYILLERFTARFTDRLIVVAARNRVTGLAHGIGREEQYEIVHSGIDAAQFRQPRVDRETVRRALGLGPSELVVGSVGNFKPQKAPLDFIDAAAAAHSRDPGLRFVLVGDGPLRPQVEARIDALGLRRVVKLLGWRRDVPDLLHAMDLFVLTSRFEGLPRSVLQAMAAGIPVIATAVDGTPEVVDHERTGLLTPPARPDLAAESILRLAGDESLRRRCVEHASRRLTEAFDIHRMVEELDDLYFSLLEPEPGPSRYRAPAR